MAERVERFDDLTPERSGDVGPGFAGRSVAVKLF